MKTITIRITQFLCIVAVATAFNVSASMTYNTTTETTGAAGEHQTMGDQKPSTTGNFVFAANYSGFEVISLADTGLATTVSEPDKKPAFVPEPSTFLAGALLLLPFAVSVVRVIRKVRAV